MIKQRIEKIRDLMKEKNLYAYIVPSSLFPVKTS